MSDGPHRSLPMHKAWKEVSKRADQATYSPADVCEAMPDAIASAWRNEVSHTLLLALKKVCMGEDNSLRLPEVALHQLAEAAPLAAGSAFGCNALAWTRQLISEGQWGEEALLQAVGNAAIERAHSGIKQVEEHYLRKSTAPRAGHVRDRLSKAAGALDAREVGARILRPAAPKSRKKTELDEGVPR